MKPLYDLQQELNRLFIAGSKFAKNDPRLQKHVPILKKLGEKAPVFNKLAQEVESLLQVESTQAAEKLLNVATLLYSVLYTQGVTVEAEAQKSEQVPTIAYKLLLRASRDAWRCLKMLLNANCLTIRGLMVT